MNIGKLQGVDNLPYRPVFLSTGEHIGYLVDGVEYHNEEHINNKRGNEK